MHDPPGSYRGSVSENKGQGMNAKIDNPLQAYNPERRFLQLMRVDGCQVVCKVEGEEPYTDAIVCFAIVETRAGEYIFNSVQAMVLSEGGTLEPAENMRHFIGVIGPGESTELHLVLASGDQSPRVHAQESVGHVR